MFFTEIAKVLKTLTNLDTQYNIVVSKINQKRASLSILVYILSVAAALTFHHLASIDKEILCLKRVSM